MKSAVRVSRWAVRTTAAVVAALCMAPLAVGDRGGAGVSGVAEARSAQAIPSLTGTIFTVAGALDWTGPRVETGLATAAAFQDPAIAAAPDGSFLVADTQGDRVLRVHPDGRASIALRDRSDSPGRGPTTNLSLIDEPGGIAALPNGGFLLADQGDDRVLEVSRDGHVSTVAGNGTHGHRGDGGPAKRAELSSPEGVAVLPRGGFLIADTESNRVRRVWPDGHISTVAGNGRPRFSGDGGRATRASLDSPAAVAGLPDGGFLIADEFNNRVRRVWPDGHISTAAGNGKDWTSGDGGAATAAAIGFVESIAVMPDGGFLIGSDESARRIWPNGTISSIIGTSSQVFAGDGGPASAAELYGQSSTGASVAALPDGSALIGWASTVRLVVGPRATPFLGAAIQPLSGRLLPHGYQARIVLTRPARVTLRVFRSMKGAPIATANAVRPGGESTLAVRLRRRAPSGLYAIDLRARAGNQTTRTEGYVYLGTSEATLSIRSVVSGLVTGELNRDPNGFISLGRCHRFGALRVDCSIFGDVDYVQALSLAPQGELKSRTYFSPIRGGKRVFERNPHWNGPPVWIDLGAVWNPFQFSY